MGFAPSLAFTSQVNALTSQCSLVLIKPAFSLLGRQGFPYTLLMVSISDWWHQSVPSSLLLSGLSPTPFLCFLLSPCYPLPHLQLPLPLHSFLHFHFICLLTFHLSWPSPSQLLPSAVSQFSTVPLRAACICHIFFHTFQFFFFFSFSHFSVTAQLFFYQAPIISRQG